MQDMDSPQEGLDPSPKGRALSCHANDWCTGLIEMDILFRLKKQDRRKSDE